MYHKAHVGLIYTHAKGDGGHNDIDILHQEVVLRLCPGGRVKSGMIGCCLDIIGTKDGSEFFHLLPRQAIDDAALSRMLLDKPDDILIDILRLGPYLVIEVRTIERALELLGIDDAEILLDITTHLVGGCGCQSDDGGRTYLIDNRTDTTIFRTEIVTPFRDTMRFVDSIEGYLHGFQEVHIILLRQRLRRHIEQFGAPFYDIRLDLIDGSLIER